MGKREKREQRKAQREAAAAEKEAASSAASRQRIRAEVSAKRCPHCGGAAVAKILYGHPDFANKELRAMLDEGLYVLGGCDIYVGQLNWLCYGCNQEFGPSAELDALLKTWGPKGT